MLKRFRFTTEDSKVFMQDSFSAFVCSDLMINKYWRQATSLRTAYQHKQKLNYDWVREW